MFSFARPIISAERLLIETIQARQVMCALPDELKPGLALGQDRRIKKLILIPGNEAAYFGLFSPFRGVGSGSATIGPGDLD